MLYGCHSVIYSGAIVLLYRHPLLALACSGLLTLVSLGCVVLLICALCVAGLLALACSGLLWLALACFWLLWLALAGSGLLLLALACSCLLLLALACYCLLFLALLHAKQATTCYQHAYTTLFISTRFPFNAKTGS